MLSWKQFCTHTNQQFTELNMEDSDIFSTWVDDLNIAIAIFDSTLAT